MDRWVINRLSHELNNSGFEWVNPSERVIQFQYKKRKIVVNLPLNYPFVPPKIYVDDKLIAYNPYNFPKRLWDNYCNYKPCPCCVNLLCSNTWSPAISMYSVIEEYLEFINKLKLYYKFKLFKQINRLPHDIHRVIFEFL